MENNEGSSAYSSCSQLGGNPALQKTSDNVWRPMQLSCMGTGPTTRNCPAQNVHGAEVVKPGPQETRTLKSEHKFRLSLRSLPKSLLSPWKHAVRLCHSSSKFGVLLSFSTRDPPRSPDLTYFPTLIFYYFPTNSFFWPR